MAEFFTDLYLEHVEDDIFETNRLSSSSTHIDPRSRHVERFEKCNIYFRPTAHEHCCLYHVHQFEDVFSVQGIAVYKITRMRWLLPSCRNIRNHVTVRKIVRFDAAKSSCVGKYEPTVHHRLTRGYGRYRSRWEFFLVDGSILSSRRDREKSEHWTVVTRIQRKNRYDGTTESLVLSLDAAVTRRRCTWFAYRTNETTTTLQRSQSYYPYLWTITTLDP